LYHTAARILGEIRHGIGVIARGISDTVFHLRDITSR
jgi:hypothetical protein